jgi:hypothetical protein
LSLAFSDGGIFGDRGHQQGCTVRDGLQLKQAIRHISSIRGFRPASSSVSSAFDWALILPACS